MKTISIKGNKVNSNIFINEQLGNLNKYIQSEHVVIITDENVSRLYNDKFPKYDVITIGIGEKIKTIETAVSIYEKLLDLDVQRSSFIVGIGGGIVCDISGFVASTFLRGIRFGFVSTTLLSQVDASVGGKNGVNLEGYKNIIGVFNQPEFVICDLNLLKTLPAKELLCGFAEIVKHALIEDSLYFDFLKHNYQKALCLDIDILEKIVYDSIMIKASVVNKDELEKGERRKLNFGHTFGHAIEKISKLAHGESVSIGMSLASELSLKKNLITENDYLQITSLLESMKLPTKCEFDKDEIISALKKDKKRKGDLIHFVLLEKIGKSIISKISIKDLDIFLNKR